MSACSVSGLINEEDQEKYQLKLEWTLKVVFENLIIVSIM